MKKRTQTGGRQILLLVSSFFLLLGVFLGAWLANTGGNALFHRVLQNAVLYQGETLAAVFLHYTKYVILLWGLGFFSIGAPLLATALAWKGMVYGYTVAGLIQMYGGMGVGVAAANYLPQSFLLLPAYVLLAAAGFGMVLGRFQMMPAKSRLRREQEKRVAEYAIFMVVMLLVVFAASAITFYLAPPFTDQLMQFYN